MLCLSLYMSILSGFSKPAFVSKYFWPDVLGWYCLFLCKAPFCRWRYLYIWVWKLIPLLRSSTSKLYVTVLGVIQYWSLLNWQTLRLHCGCGSCKLNFFTLFHHFSLNLRTLYIVLSLVRRRVTRHLTRLKTMCKGLNYRKIF